MSNATQSLAGTRITSLLDANSFVEIGQGVTARSTDFNMTANKAPSDGVITGYGVIDDKLVYVYSQDASVLNGTVGEMHAKKITRLYDLAMKTGAPVIGFVDCAGIRLQEATDALEAFGQIYLKQTLASHLFYIIKIYKFHISLQAYLDSIFWHSLFIILSVSTQSIPFKQSILNTPLYMDTKSLLVIFSGSSS